MLKRLNVLALLLSIIMMAGCSDPAKQELQSYVKETQASCPIMIADNVMIDKVEYADNIVTYTVSTRSPLLSVAALKAQSATIKPTVVEAIKGSTDDKVSDEIQLIRDAGAQLRVVVSDGTDDVTFSFAADEL